MQPTADRILTTHSGSLPRPAEFLPLLLAQEAGRPVDDAEVSKPSYATYVKDRLTGFGGKGSIEEITGSVTAGLEEFPDFAEKMAQTMASAQTIKFTTCDGPVSYVGQDAVRADIENLKAA